MAPKIIPDRAYSVRYTKVVQERGDFFVPDYAKHRPACRAVMAGGVYEPATHRIIHDLMQHRGGSMVHAGTFFGDMLPSFSRSCPGTVYAFEPVLENYVLAKLCVEANNLGNVYLLNAGLSDRAGIGHIDTGNPGQAHRGGASRLAASGQQVSLMTIDSLGIEDIAIIQLDVEGHELPALNGARATIERAAPIILVEDNPRVCAPFLRDLGYHHVGTLPEQMIWARPDDHDLITRLLPKR